MSFHTVSQPVGVLDSLMLIVSFCAWARDGGSGGLVAELCPTLCDPVDCSPPGFSVHGIPQTRILEWVAISFSRGSSWPTSPALAGRFCRFFTDWATREAGEREIVNMAKFSNWWKQMEVSNQRCSLYYSFRISVDLIFFKIEKLRASIFFAEVVYCESGEIASLPITFCFCFAVSRSEDILETPPLDLKNGDISGL